MEPSQAQQSLNEWVNSNEYKKYQALQKELEGLQNRLSELRKSKNLSTSSTDPNVPSVLNDQQYKTLQTITTAKQQERNAAKIESDNKKKEIEDRIYRGIEPPPKTPNVPATPQENPATPSNEPIAQNNATNALNETPEEKKAREDREKALREQLTGEDGAAKLRLGYQAALMMMIDKILIDSAKFTNGLRRDQLVYSNFVTSRTGNVGHVDLSNVLFKTLDTRLFFNKIPPHILSALVPSVKLYYVIYPSIQGQYKPSVNNTSKGYSWRIPFDDLPTSYGLGTVNESSEFVSDTLEKILKGEGKMNGCGIKSFQYAYKGTNTAETNSHIEASLELFFQDINLLTKKITITENDTRFLEGKPTGLTGEGKEFSYSHLVSGASRYIRSGPSLLVNDQYFRIKAEVGFAEPSEIFRIRLAQDGGLTLEEVNSYINAIRNAKISFFLSPVTHDITFNEDGTVILKINYQATIDAILSDFNLDIFSLSSKSADIRQAQKELEAILDERQSRINTIKCGRSSGNDANALKNINDNFAKKLEDKKTILENLKTNLQQDIYKKLVGVEQLKNNKSISAYKVKILNSAVGVDKEGKPISGALQFRLLEGAVIRQKGLKDHSRISVKDVPQNSANAKPPPKEGDNSTAQKGINFGDLLSSFDFFSSKKDEKGPQAEIDSDYVTVKYVFFGDILDIVMECLAEINPAIDRPKIILGEIPINIPVNISSEEIDLTVPQDADLLEIIVNIADIPISLEASDDFYYKNVIKQKRADYPLLSFIKDIFEELLKPAINPSVFGKKATINNSIRVSHFGFNIPLKNPDTEPIFERPITDNFNGSITNETLGKISSIDGKTKKTFSQELNGLGLANYLYIYDSLSSPRIIRDNGGLIDRDEASGIYHFSIGKESGIVKAINFTKTEIPLAAEARALQEGGKVTNRLRQMYSSEIKLFGNNIFRPGDYIFIEPIIYGSNIQDTIGIGGYYIVTRVNTSMSPDSFETVLSCNHQAWASNGRTRLPKDNGRLC